MTPHALRQAAETMDISYQAAVTMRLRYVIAQLDLNFRRIYMDTDELPEMTIKEAQSERSALLRSLQGVPKGEVTDEMIERARGADIRPLLEWARGRTTCPFHEDKSPSAYYGTKTGKLICPVCNESWDAIELLRKRDGMGFKEAVKNLCR